MKCRYCGTTTFARDDTGPTHACCYAWRAVIEAGFPCPSCQVARMVANSPNGWMPHLQPLPRFLPDGRPYVPEIAGGSRR